MKTLLAAALLVPTMAIAARQPDLLERIAIRQQQLDRYAVEMQIRVFGAPDSAADIAFQARAARSGPAMLQEFQHYIVLLHPEMRLVIDRNGRTIHLNAAHLETPVPPAADPAALLDRARGAGYSIDVDERPDDIALRFTSERQPTFLLTFGTADLRLRRMEMQGPASVNNPQGRTVVTYTWHELNESHAARMTPAYYVQRAADGWRPTAAFDGFRVVTSREK